MALLLDSLAPATPETARSTRAIARGFEPIRPARIDGWPNTPMPVCAPRAVWRIARDVKIGGELVAALDVAIDGLFDGRIDVSGHRLSTGAVSRVHANLVAETVLIRGEFVGSIVAGRRIVLARTARVRGDLVAPDVKLADGCTFDGTITRPESAEH